MWCDDPPAGSASCVHTDRAEDGALRVAQRPRSLPNAAGRRQPCRCHAAAAPDKEQKDRTIARKASDTRAAWDFPFAPARRACQCRPACVRPRCSDEKIHAAPDKLVARTPECIDRGNRADASAVKPAQLLLCAIKSGEKSRAALSRIALDA